MIRLTKGMPGWKAQKGRGVGERVGLATKARAAGTWKAQKGKGNGERIGKAIGKSIGKSIGNSARESAQIGQMLLIRPPILDQFGVNDLFHATVYGTAILLDGFLTGKYKQHGNQSCVWASESVEKAIRHLVNTPRHKDKIKDADFYVHIFQIKDITAHRALFRPQSRGYSTSKSYNDAGGHNIQLDMGNGHTIESRVINIKQFYLPK